MGVSLGPAASARGESSNGDDGLENALRNWRLTSPDKVTQCFYQVSIRFLGRVVLTEHTISRSPLTLSFRSSSKFDTVGDIVLTPSRVVEGVQLPNRRVGLGGPLLQPNMLHDIPPLHELNIDEPQIAPTSIVTGAFSQSSVRFHEDLAFGHKRGRREEHSKAGTSSHGKRAAGVPIRDGRFWQLLFWLLTPMGRRAVGTSETRIAGKPDKSI